MLRGRLACDCKSFDGRRDACPSVPGMGMNKSGKKTYK